MAISAIRRVFSLVFIAGVLALSVGPIAQAEQTIVPDRRIAIYQNMDFPGSDLGTVFETNFESCMKICLTDSLCRLLLTAKTGKNIFVPCVPPQITLLPTAKTCSMT